MLLKLYSEQALCHTSQLSIRMIAIPRLIAASVALGGAPHYVVHSGHEPTKICYNETWGKDGIVPSPYPTCVFIEANMHGLNMEFVAENDEIQHNAYTECNSDMFNHATFFTFEFAHFSNFMLI